MANPHPYLSSKRAIKWPVESRASSASPSSSAAATSVVRFLEPGFRPGLPLANGRPRGPGLGIFVVYLGHALDSSNAASFRVSATALLPSAAPRQAHRRAATSSRGPLLRGGPSWFPRTERVVSALVFGGTEGRGRPQGEAVTMKTDIPETVIHRHSTCS